MFEMTKWYLKVSALPALSLNTYNNTTGPFGTVICICLEYSLPQKVKKQGECLGIGRVGEFGVLF
jgi:hypothetical protein